MIHQDSTHPTGVSTDSIDRKQNGTVVARARSRKAQAALSLRLGRANWDEIAEICGYPSAAAAKRAVEGALVKELSSDGDKERMRRYAGAQLNQLLRSIWAKAVDPLHPEQMTALTKARELIDQHAKLFGLNAPTEINVNPTAAEIERWVAAVVSGRVPQVEEYDILQASEQEDGSYAVSRAV